MRMRSAFDSIFQLCNGIVGSNEGTGMEPMIIIEVLPHPNHNNWKLFNRANSIEEAREIAAKAILKTNYLAVRIRES